MEYHPKLRPMDTPTDGIFLAGACQGQKDIPASVSSGSAAASRAGRILHSDEWAIEPIIAQVWEDRCISAQGKQCGICAKACPYGAITVETGTAAQVVTGQVPRLRRLRGGMPAQCHHPDALHRRASAGADPCFAGGQTEEKILAFRCHWCSYGGADLAGTSHFEYPPTRAASA